MRRAEITSDPIGDLILSVAAHDIAAFRQLYSAAGATLMGVLVRMLGRRAEAEEALQDVFTKVWLRAGGYDASKGRGMTWLIALARHLAIDRLRTRHDHVSDSLAIEAAAGRTPSAETQMVAIAEARRILQCFSTLEPDQAAALRGAYLNGDSYIDLAARFDVPLNTMRTRLRRGLLKLRVCMAE